MNVLWNIANLLQILWRIANQFIDTEGLNLSSSQNGCCCILRGWVCSWMSPRGKGILVPFPCVVPWWPWWIYSDQMVQNRGDPRLGRRNRSSSNLCCHPFPGLNHPLPNFTPLHLPPHPEIPPCHHSFSASCQHSLPAGGEMPYSTFATASAGEAHGCLWTCP